MAGTVTESYIQYDKEKGKAGKIVAQLACVGDSEDGSLPDTALSAALMTLIRGMYLQFMVTKPGSPAPTAAYDITLIGGSTALDILGGAGADRSASAAEQVMPVISATAQKRLVHENLTFKVANQSENSAVITVWLIFTRD